MRRDHGRIFFLAAKRAAGFRLHDANSILGQVEKRHQRLVDVVRTLQRAPDRDALLGVERGDHAVVFDVELLLRAGGVFAFDDVVRPCSQTVSTSPF